MPPSKWKHNAPDGNIRERLTRVLMSALKLGAKGNVEVSLKLGDELAPVVRTS